MLQKLYEVVTKTRAWAYTHPNTIRKIISYASTFLSIFSAILLSKEQDILLMIYNDGLSVTAFVALLGAIWRTAIKAVIQLLFCLLFPSFFRKQGEVQPRVNDV